MMRAFASAVSGLQNHQTYMDVVSNDIANVNTIGYKSSRYTFKDSFSQVLKDASFAGGGLGSTNAHQVGLGVGTGSIDSLMTQGAVNATGNPLDVAISGNGFFRVTDDIAGFGNVQYTRAGNFQQDDQGRLITAEGYFIVGVDVLPGPPPTPGATNQTLTIPETARSMNIDQNGLVSYIDAAGATTLVGYIGISTFPNQAGLQRVAGNRWAESASSGAPQNSTANVGGAGSVQSRSLELANVDIAGQFAEMIKAQRGFQANSRTITTADEMLRDLVQMKR